MFLKSNTRPLLSRLFASVKEFRIYMVKLGIGVDSVALKIMVDLGKSFVLYEMKCFIKGFPEGY